jgi:microsomal epoxide hydrolase
MARPFRIEIPPSALEDLQARLAATRWPDEIDAVGWDYGLPLQVLRELLAYWRTSFDWRNAEARINAFEQFMETIDGLDTHFIHQRSAHQDATPLLLTHGWPGSIVEFLEVIPRLTAPEKFGGRAADAFHVVCPSLPGYGFSQAARQPGMGPKQIAERHLRLMQILGYGKFVAQGGDWGSIISRFLPDLAPDRLLGLHLNFVVPRLPQGVSDPRALCTPQERQQLEQDAADRDGITGYQHIQRTKPQTLAYGLADSPSGLAAWIGEKFHGWTDNNGDMRDAVSWDAVLTNISLYWFTNTIASSVRLYREYDLGIKRGDKPSRRTEVPFGAALYRKELVRSARAWVEREYNLIHWFEADRGGHFAALEEPEIFAQDLWTFHARLKAYITSQGTASPA